MINERIANKQFCSVLIHPQSACWSHSAQHSSIPACSQRLVHSRSCSSSDVAHPPPFRSAHCSTAWHAPLYNSVIQAFFFLPQHTSEIMSVSSFLINDSNSCRLLLFLPSSAPVYLFYSLSMIYVVVHILDTSFQVLLFLFVVFPPVPAIAYSCGHRPP